MRDKIVNRYGELLYKLVPEKKDDKDGYRLYRVKPTKFGNTVINTDDICGWISNQIQQQNIEDFYFEESYPMIPHQDVRLAQMERSRQLMLRDSLIFTPIIEYM